MREPNRLQRHLTLPISNPLIPTPFEALLEFFKEKKLTFEADEENMLVRLGFTTANGQFPVFATTNEDHDTLEVVTIIPNHVPPEKRSLMAEFCVRVNHGSCIARLDLDFPDGELRSFASAPFVKGDLPDEVIGQCVNASLLGANQLYPAIMSVLYADISPEAALKRLGKESKPEDPEQFAR